MIIHKVNMIFDLGDTAIKGSGYMSYKPEFASDLIHLVPKWVAEACTYKREYPLSCMSFHSFSFRVLEVDIIDLLNSQESFTVHDIYEG